MRRLLPLFLCSLLSLPMAGTAVAGDSFWSLPGDAKKERYESHMAVGDDLTVSAERAFRKSRSRARRIAGQALAAYDEAIQADPTREEPHYRAGEVLSAYFIDGAISPPNRLRQAIAHWKLFEEKAPLDPRLPQILFDRAIAQTKLRTKRDLEQAVADYDHELELIDQVGEARRETMGTVLSNRAELLMMLGRLGGAIKGYEQALQYKDDALYGYGLAVALDRDLQGERSRDVARIYSQSDAGNALHRDGTFFVPPGEKYYYVAIQQEGKGNYREAVIAYREFLRMLPGSQWGARARENLEAVLPKAAKQPKSRKRGDLELNRLNPWP